MYYNIIYFESVRMARTLFRVGIVYCFVSLPIFIHSRDCIFRLTISMAVARIFCNFIACCLLYIPICNEYQQMKYCDREIFDLVFMRGICLVVWNFVNFFLFFNLHRVLFTLWSVYQKYICAYVWPVFSTANKVFSNGFLSFVRREIALMWAFKKKSINCLIHTSLF